MVVLEVEDHGDDAQHEQEREHVLDHAHGEALAFEAALACLEEEGIGRDRDREHEDDQEGRERIADVARRWLGL